MPQTRECDYCGADIEPGTGTMFVRKNGTTIHFCSSKCEKNADLGREARDLSWTESGRRAGGRATEAEPEEVETESDEEPDDEAEAVESGDEDADVEDEAEADDEEDADAEADDTDEVDASADESDEETDTEEPTEADA